MITRSDQLAQAVWWCAVSVAWAAVAGATALIAGLLVGSVALIGFGADSIVDGSASAVLVGGLAPRGQEPSTGTFWSAAQLDSSEEFSF